MSTTCSTIGFWTELRPQPTDRPGWRHTITRLAEWWWSHGTVATLFRDVRSRTPVLLEEGGYSEHVKGLAQAVFCLTEVALYRLKRTSPAGLLGRACSIGCLLLPTISLGLFVAKVVGRYLVKDHATHLYHAKVEAGQIPGRSKLAFDQVFGLCGAVDSFRVAATEEDVEHLLQKNSIVIYQENKNTVPRFELQIQQVQDTDKRARLTLSMEGRSTESWKVRAVGGLDYHAEILVNGKWQGGESFEKALLRCEQARIGSGVLWERATRR